MLLCALSAVAHRYARALRGRAYERGAACPVGATRRERSDQEHIRIEDRLAWRERQFDAGPADRLGFHRDWLLGEDSRRSHRCIRTPHADFGTAPRERTPELGPPPAPGGAPEGARVSRPPHRSRCFVGAAEVLIVCSLPFACYFLDRVLRVLRCPRRRGAVVCIARAMGAAALRGVLRRSRGRGRCIFGCGMATICCASGGAALQGALRAI